jgi:hypothetical protein
MSRSLTRQVINSVDYPCDAAHSFMLCGERVCGAKLNDMFIGKSDSLPGFSSHPSYYSVTSIYLWLRVLFYWVHCMEAFPLFVWQHISILVPSFIFSRWLCLESEISLAQHHKCYTFCTHPISICSWYFRIYIYSDPAGLCGVGVNKSF